MEVNVTLVQLVYHDAASHLPTSECFHRVFPNWAVKAKKRQGKKNILQHLPSLSLCIEEIPAKV